MRRRSGGASTVRGTHLIYPPCATAPKPGHHRLSDERMRNALCPLMPCNFPVAPSSCTHERYQFRVQPVSVPHSERAQAMTSSSVFPLLPLRDVVVFPHMVIPLFVGRSKSIEALEAAMQGDKQVLLMTQRNPAVDDPEAEDLYRVGTLATILQLLKLPDGTVKVLVEGEQRAQVEQLEEVDGYQQARVQLVEEPLPEEREAEVLARTLMSQFEQFVNLGKKVPPEAVSSLSGIEDVRRLVETMTAHLNLKVEQKQQILEIASVRDRVEHVLGVLDTEIDLLQVEKRIRGRVKKQMERSQREYYLNEQMKAIQKEMGASEDGSSELDELQKRIESAGMSKEALEKAKAELNKLKMMSPMSAEATVVRS